MEEGFFLCLLPQDGTRCEGQPLPSPRVRTQHMELRVVSCDPDVPAVPVWASVSLRGEWLPEISNCSSTAAILGT